MSAPNQPPLLDPAAYVEDVEATALKRGFRVERFGEIAGFPLIALSMRTPGPRPRVYISAGIHGDEPAGPLAVLEALRRGVFDHRAVWLICPLLNPIGFTLRTRENAEGLDLNRDYRALKSAEIRAHARWLKTQPNFDFAVCIHEDWESNGYYLYELNPTAQPSLAHPIINAVAAHCPIEAATVIDGRPIAEPGIIRPIDDPLAREQWPEAIYLRAHHTKLTYTLETPSGFPLAQRVGAHVVAIQTAVDFLRIRS